MLDHELSKLNKVIDYKINHGISYKQEAKLHKRILKRLRQIKNKKGLLAFL